MSSYQDMFDMFSDWMKTPLEPLVKNSIESESGVAHSEYEINGRIAALIIAIHPKKEPYKSLCSHYFDENAGNSIDSIKGATYSLILDDAFERAAAGYSTVFVIYNPPVVIIASVVEHQIKALENDYLH